MLNVIIKAKSAREGHEEIKLDETFMRCNPKLDNEGLEYEDEHFLIRIYRVFH